MFNIILAGLTSLFTDIGSEMVYPLIPLFLVSQMGATPAIVGVIEGFAESLASLLKVFSGYYSDKLGRRKGLAIAGYSLSAAAKIPIIIAVSWAWVLFGRVADRFGKGVRTAPRDAIIADAAEEGQRGRAFGLHRALDTLGAVIGVALAYMFFTSYHGDYRTVFFWSLLPAILGVGILLGVREKKPQPVGKKTVSLKWSTLDNRLKWFLLVVFLFALGNSSNQFLLLRAHDLGYSVADVILLYLVYNLVYAVVAYPAGLLSDILGRRTLLVTGYLFYALVYLGFALVTEKHMMWYLFATYGLYTGITEGVEKALVSDIAPAEQKATMMGLHATLVGIGLLPASLLAGALWKWFGPSVTFYFGAVTGILATAGLLVVLGQLPGNRKAQGV